MCERCEELEEEVAYLKSELGIREAGERIHLLRAALGVRPAVASFLLRLYDARGKLVTHQQLVDALPAVWCDREDRHEPITRVYCAYARKALGRDGIETVWREGYRLSATARDRIEVILAAPRPAVAA